MANTAQAIVAAVKEALDLWKTFIATRQQAYERRMDKRQEAAIRYAEKAFDKMGVLFQFLYENVDIPEKKKAEFDRIKTIIYKYRDKFNKYD